MSSIYTNAGDQIKDHIHRLERIAEPPYKYRCVTCNAHLERLSGVLVKAGLHDLIECPYSDGWYHGKSTRRGGQWIFEYACPTCQRKGKFLRNYLGQRKVMCDGVKFTKVAG